MGGTQIGSVKIIDLSVTAAVTHKPMARLGRFLVIDSNHSIILRLLRHRFTFQPFPKPDVVGGTVHRQAVDILLKHFHL